MDHPVQPSVERKKSVVGEGKNVLKQKSKIDKAIPSSGISSSGSARNVEDKKKRNILHDVELTGPESVKKSKKGAILPSSLSSSDTHALPKTGYVLDEGNRFYDNNKKSKRKKLRS